MPDRLAENLLMFIRQNKGKVPNRRRTAEFSQLTDAEVAMLEGVVREGFEEFDEGEEVAVRGLQFSATDERYVFDREVVVFWGQDGDKPVRFEISQEALDDHFGGDGKDKLEVFRANRQAIEEIARREYLAGRTEPDGSVLIRTVER